MASLWALLTATQAARASTWLTRLARGLGADDPRSMDTRRADILAALLSGQLVGNPGTAHTATAPTPRPPDTATADTGRPPTRAAATASPPTSPLTARPAPPTRATATPATPTPRTPHRHRQGGRRRVDRRAGGDGTPDPPVTPGKPLIQIVDPYSTLIGADDRPAELVGVGPDPRSLAREPPPTPVWRGLITDPLSGTLLDHGRTTYHPPSGLADHVTARDLHCRFPGCRRSRRRRTRPLIAWSDGGTTSEPNLAATCTHHHRLKTHSGLAGRGPPRRPADLDHPDRAPARHSAHDTAPTPGPPASPPPAPAGNDSALDPPPF